MLSALEVDFPAANAANAANVSLNVYGATSIQGGTIDLNTSGSSDTNINTGSSTGAVNIGNSASGAVTLQAGSAGITLNPVGGDSISSNLQSVDSTNTLNSISCSTASFCAAVDASKNLVTTTNSGSSWTVTSLSSVFPYSAPSSISCVGSTFCIAFDSNTNMSVSTNPTGGAGTWSYSSSPIAAAPSYVSCVSSTFCVLGAGVYIASSTTPATGSSWSNKFAATTGVINDVSCATTSLCVAVDSVGDVITSTNPTGGSGAWTTTDIDGATSITSISCPTTGLCVAVDSAGNVLTSTNPTGGSGAWTTTDVDGSSLLKSVSCASTTYCAVVDSAGNALISVNPTGGAGTWVAQSIDSHTPQGVSCFSSTFCTAVDNGGNAITFSGGTTSVNGVLVKPTSNTANTFQVQDAGGAAVLDVNTNDETVTVTGSSTESTQIFDGTYTVSQPSYPGMTSFSGTDITSDLGDDVMSDAISLPFSFTYFGTSYNTIYVCSNGFITFDGSDDNCDTYSSGLPTLEGLAAIAANWADLDTNNGGTVTYGTVGSGSDQTFIVYFNDVAYYQDGTYAPTTFQIKLNEADNSIELDVQTMPNDSSATQGIESPDGSTAYCYSTRCTSVGALTDDSVLFKPDSTPGTPGTAALSVTATGSGNALQVEDSSGSSNYFSVSAATGETYVQDTLSVGGSENITNSTDSANEFQVQSASGASLLNVDSTDAQIDIGGTLASPGSPAAPPSGGGTVGSWQSGTSLLTATFEAASVAYNGYIYEIGGTTNDSTGLTTVDYAPLNSNGSLGSWNSTTSLPSAVFGGTAVVYNGYVYVIGGVSGHSGSGDSCSAYAFSAPINSNGTIGSWSDQSKPVGSCQNYLSTAVVNNGYVYVIGGGPGVIGNAPVSTVYYATLSSGTIGTWSSTSSLAYAVSGATAVVNNGYIYVMGGATSGNSCSASNSVYTQSALINSNGTLNNWTATGSLTNGRFGLAGVAWGGYGYILGGNVTGSGCSTASYEEEYSSLSSGSTSWSNGANAYGGFLDTATVYNGYMYELGGTTNGTAGLSTVEYASVSGNQGTPAIPATSNSGDQVNLSVDGTVTIQPATDSTSAFEVQDSSGDAVLQVDTTNTNPNGTVAVVANNNNWGMTITNNTGYGLAIGQGSTSNTGPAFQITSGVSDTSGTWEALMYSNCSTSCQAIFGFERNGEAYSHAAYNSGGLDYAEWFQADDTSISQQDLVALDPSDPDKVVLAGPGDTPIGVISTHPSVVGAPYGLSIDQMSSLSTSPNWKIVGLTGQIPTNVTAANGAIEPGDPLTSSSTPGYAELATSPGNIIGYAAGSLSSGTGTITVLVEPGYYAGPSSATYLQNGDSANFSDMDVSGDTTLSDLGVSGTANFSDINASGTATVNDLAVSGNTATQSLNVTGSATVGSLDVAGSATVGSLEVTGTMTADSASITGALVAGSLNVSGMATVVGLTVNGSATINGDLTLNGHLITGGSAPTTAVGAAAGVQQVNGVSQNEGACTVSGNDTSGTVTLITGTDSLASGTECTLTFAKTFGATPRSILSPMDKNSLQIGAYLTPSTAGAALNFINTPAANTTYTFNYWNPQ